MVYKRQKDAELLIGFADADWAGDKNDRKSVSGSVFMVFGNTVSWWSRKQASISLSSTEAEYVSLAEGICEVKWMKGLFKEIGLSCKQPITIFEDNQSCKKIAEEPRDRKKLKHIDVKYKFVQKAVEDDEIKLLYKQSNQQTADIMTKAIGRVLFEKHRQSLNLIT